MGFDNDVEEWGFKVIFGGAVALLVVLGVVAPIGGWLNVQAPGSGTHVGYVTAVGESGMIWTTGMVWFKTDLESTQEDVYCLDKGQPGYAELQAQLSAYADENTRVRISYVTELVMPPWQCAWEDAIVVDVDPVKPQGGEA